MGVHHALGVISRQRNNGYRPSRVNIMPQVLSTPDPSLSPTHSSRIRILRILKIVKKSRILANFKTTNEFYYYPPFARRAKGEVFVLLYVFCLFGERFLSNPRADSRHILHAGVAWVGTCLLPFWGSATPGGAKRGKMTCGWSHSCTGQLPFLFFFSDAKCSPICMAQT